MKSLSGLRCFIEVGRTGSFATSARQLGLSTSAVSKAVARLEQELGVRLLNRTTRRVGLTPEGERMLDAAVQPLLDLEALATEFGDESAMPRGLLRVSVPVALGRQWLVPRLPEFFVRYPMLRLDLSQDDRAADLIADRMDVVIRTGELADSQTLIARRLFAEPVVTCASPAYLGKHGKLEVPGDLADHDCIEHRTRLSGRPYKWRFLVDGTVVDWPISARLLMDDGESVVRAARHGLGISQMPLSSPEMDWRRVT